MATVIQAIRFLDKHKGVALLLGGFGSMTAGAAWWLAKGGAVALTTSVLALSDPEIAATLESLPKYHKRVEAALESQTSALASIAAAQRQMADALESYRADNERVVDWAREHSQRLTDDAGGCTVGQEKCVVYFRGRRTQAGAGCVLRVSKPYIIMPDGREFPVSFSQGFQPIHLTTEFETMPVQIDIPGHIEPGHVGILILNYYAECPFAPADAIIERETFRLLLEIKPAS